MELTKDKYLLYQPLVSIIIPSYNRENTVSTTIDSILTQQCNFNFEIVIGDDCSTDNAREVVLDYQKKYPQKIILLFHDKNIGLGANWATCVKHCRGKYIANCDNDDYWHNPDKLQLQVDFFESHPEYGVCHTDYRNHNRETEKITEVVVSSDTFDISLQKAIFSGKFRCCNATMMYRKELMNKYLNLDDYIHFQFTLQDWNTWIILAKYTQFYCLPVSTATFGVETESITRPKEYDKVIQRFKKEIECYKYVCDKFPKDLPYDEQEYDAYVNHVLLGLAYKKLDFPSARKYGSLLSAVGNTNLKVKCSTTIFTFYSHGLALKIKAAFKKY
jgi:glycosyltransferase involved in cell wall biosynthesis